MAITDIKNLVASDFNSKSADSVSRAEGSISLEGGMNAGVSPATLLNTQCYFGLNVSFRGGQPHTRPAFTNMNIALGAATTGHFQGAASYRLNSADRVVCVIAGRVIGIQTDTLAIVDYSAQAGVGLLDAEVDRCYFCVADKYMIVQDGENAAVIIDGATARRAVQTADPATTDGVLDHPETYEVPIGTIMAYGHGRLFVVPKEVQSQDGRRFFLAGDIMQASDPATLLQFTETQYLSGGGAFALPNEMGFITGMTFLRNTSTGSGFGALIVMAQRGASAFAVNAPRSQWQDIDISQVLFQSVGTFSPSSLLAVNNDIYFRGTDGIRTLNYSIQEISQGSNGIRNNPISREVSYILKYDTRISWPFITTGLADNRFFCTSVPTTASGDQAFQALIVMDVDPVSSLATPVVTPIYDGAWTGHNFLWIVTARYHGLERDALYAFVKEDDGTNAFYMLNVDGYVAGVSEVIRCRVYTKTFFFGDIVSNKEFGYGEFDISNVLGNVYLRSFYKPAGYPLYGSMGQAMIHANDEGRVQRRQALRMTPVDDVCDPLTGTLLTFSKSFDFVVQWVGYMQLDASVFVADVKSRAVVMACEMETNDHLLAAPGDGWDLDPFGVWDVFDPFISQGDWRWVYKPFYWRRNVNGHYDFGGDPTWPDVPLGDWEINPPSGSDDPFDGEDNDSGGGIREFIAVRKRWANPNTNFIEIDSGTPGYITYIVQVLSTRKTFEMGFETVSGAGISVKTIAWGAPVDYRDPDAAIAEALKGFPLYERTALVQFGLDNGIQESMGLRAATFDIGRINCNFKANVQGRYEDDSDYSLLPKTEFEVAPYLIVNQAEYTMSIPETIEFDVPFDITITAISKKTSNTLPWHKSDGSIEAEIVEEA